MKNIVSSAKSKWLTWGLALVTLIPFKEPSSLALLHSPERTSPHKIKMYGERGSPWRIPLLGCTLPLGEPLMRKEYVTVDTHSNIQLVHVSWNPSRFSTSSINFHSSLSYALLMSVLTAIEHLFSASEFFKKWRTSCVISTLSEIARPGTKADWFSEMIEERSGCSLLVRILEMIL